MLSRHAVFATVLVSSLLCAQDSGSLGQNSASVPVKPPPKRIFWIIPNYRTSDTPANYEPLSARQKFKLATSDAFDPGTFLLGGLFGAEGQLSNSNPSFGQGAAGYGRYFVTSYADYGIGDYMTEAIFPTMLHQDPRFFRRGTGTGWSRMGHAMGQIFWTRMDNGRYNVNFSELGGNAAAVAISQAYYPDNRDPSDAVAKWGTQIAVDMTANVLKEFWPDIDRKFFHRQKQDSPAGKP